MSNDNRIKGKILWRGQIECLSPLHVGSGRDERSDLDILLDTEGKPFIPATSFIGILRHAVQERFPEKFEKNFWGYTENDDGRQSALCCSDLTLANAPSTDDIVTRDGIRIDNTKGLVKKGGKFDFELLERGSRFGFKFELTFREQDEAVVKQTARAIYDLLAEGGVRLGAKTNSGFGYIRLVEAETRIYLFDFSRDENGSRKAKNSPQDDVCNWLKQNFSEQNSISVAELGEPVSAKEKRFSITATLRLKNSLIVRSYARDPKMSDTTQLKSRKDWVIPGNSLKGAIRARAERIVNTLELKNAEHIINELFGKVDDERRSKNAKKGRVRMWEITMAQNDFPAELQTRIRVDRFTGGVIEGGLFDSMPIFAPKQDKTMTLHLDVRNCKEYEAGLLLLVLKDLWSGDLAIGGEKNIGRGVFQGERAEIVWDDEQIILEKDMNNLSADAREKLQGLVKALVTEPV